MSQNEREKAEDKFERKTKNLPDLPSESVEKKRESDGGQDA